MKPKPQATLTCHVHVRLDGRDPGLDHPASEGDYREEYRAFWLRFEEWLRAEGITPVIWPGAVQWWHVAYASPFRIDEVERVVLWLHAQGVEVTNISGSGGK